MTIDAIRAIANSTLPKAETDASKSGTSFKNLTLDVGAFGSSPLGKELGHQHQGAHEVFFRSGWTVSMLPPALWTGRAGPGGHDATSARDGIPETCREHRRDDRFTQRP